MAISSNEISNIISGQVGMFCASAQYAQALSSQYGFQTGGSIGIQDPRDQSGAQLQAGNLGAMGARMPGYAMAGMAGMAMFNVAPRIFDPFTTGAHMIRRGYLGGGMAGAVGMGIGAAGLMYGASSVGGWMGNQMVTGAQNRGLLNSQISNIFPHMNSGGLNMMAGQVESMSRQGMGSIRELASLMQQGAANGALDTGSLNQFSQSFRKLIQNVRQVANVLNTSMTEAGQAMQSVKAIGVRSGDAANFLGAAKGIGTAAHLSPQQMMAVAHGGSQFGFSAGIERQTGAMGAMVSAGVYSMAQNNEYLNVDSGSQSRYTRAATRFLLGRRGRTVLGAMMNRDGELDTQRAAQIARGAYSREELREMYSSNINNQTMRRHLRNRGTEIAGQFISQFGPEAISGSLEALTRGSVDGTSRDTERLQQTLTGLNRRDIDSMKQLAASAPMLRQKLIDEARAGFREGQMSVSATQMMGIAFDKMIKPMRESFRDFGAGMTRAAGQAMEDVTKEFVSSPAARPDFAGAHRQDVAWRGGNKAAQAFYGPQGFGGQVGMTTMPGRATGWGSFANYLPSGLRLGAMPDGTGLDELPMGGFGTLDPMDGLNVGVAGMGIRYSRVFPGNRNIIGAAGALSNWAGKGYDRLATMGMPRGPGGAVQHPWMGMTGVNTLRGAARFPGGLARLGGWGMMGLGRVAGALSLPMMAYGMATGGAAARRSLGMDGIAEGAISGNNARLLRSLKDIGFLDSNQLQYHDITDVSRKSFPGTPVAGVTGAGGQAGGTGYQGFLTPEGGDELERLYGTGQQSGGGYLSAGLEKGRELFGVGSDAEVLAKLRMQFAKDDDFMSLDPADRLKTFHGALGAQFRGKGIQYSAKDTAALALGVPELGIGIQVTRENLRKMSSEEQIKKHGTALSNISGAQAAAFQINKDDMGLVSNFGTVMGSASSANSMHDAQRAFIDGHTDRAKSFIRDAVSPHFSGQQGRNLEKYILGQMDPNSPLSQFSGAVAKSVGSGGTGISPLIGLNRQAQYQGAAEEFARDIGDNRSKYHFALEQGGRFLGRAYVNTNEDMNQLTDGTTAYSHLGGMRESLVEDLGKMYSLGKGPSDVAIRNSISAYGRGGAAGETLATTLSNANNLFKDYKRVKGRDDRSARFLTRASRRMGLELDFTKFDSTHDVAALAGKQTDGNKGMSSKLQAELREFGRGLVHLQTGDSDISDNAAEREASKVLDLLNKHDGDATKAIERMTTLSPPVSPTSGKAAQGGLQQKVGQIDTAVEGVVTALNNAAKRINDTNK